MKIRRLAVISTIAFASGISLAPGSAYGDGSVCPDGYQLYPSIVLIDGAQTDKNNNGFVCIKGPQGSNDHFNGKDDKGIQYTDDII
jgi:hypothetical protein